MIGRESVNGGKEPEVPEFRCVDAGSNCNGYFKAETKEDLMREVAAHFKEKHGVGDPTQTIMNLVAKLAK
jgi:predicted small metal-binding protein